MALTSDVDPVEQMESLLTCAMCLEMFNDPRTLPCFHSFCKSCLEKFVKSQRDKAVSNEIEEFNCPTCRSIFILKSNEEVSEMNSSHFIRNMLEVVSIQRRALTANCSRCEEQATSRCVTCQLFMCPTCLGNHDSTPCNKKHSVVSTSEIISDPAGNQAKLRDKLRCSKHDNKTLKFYCETCKELACRYCMEFDHKKKKHSCLLAEDVSEKKKQQLRISFGILEGKLKKGNQALQTVSDVTQRLNENFERAKDEVRQDRQKLLETFILNLDLKEEEMINQLDQEYNTVCKPLAQQNAKIKSYVEKIKISVDFTKNLLEKGNLQEIISSQGMIEEKAEKMNKERPRPIKPVHDGYILYKSKAIKDETFCNILDNFGETVCSRLSGALHDVSNILEDEEDYVDQMEEWLNGCCKWRLCYRATRHWWSAEDFHLFCDNKGPTVTLVKVGEFIFGGYTDQNWGVLLVGTRQMTHQDGAGHLRTLLAIQKYKRPAVQLYRGSGYKESTTSFLFSLRNKDSLPPFKAPIFRYYKNATWHNPNYGPCFGYGYYGCDLYICNNPHICTQSYTNLGYVYKPPEGYAYREEKTYSLLAGSYYFQPTEIEVFY